MKSTIDQDPPTSLDPRGWYVASVGRDRTDQEVSSKGVPGGGMQIGKGANGVVEARPEGFDVEVEGRGLELVCFMTSSA